MWKVRDERRKVNGEWCRKMIGKVDKERSGVELGEWTAWNNAIGNEREETGGFILLP